MCPSINRLQLDDYYLPTIRICTEQYDEYYLLQPDDLISRSPTASTQKVIWDINDEDNYDGRIDAKITSDKIKSFMCRMDKKEREHLVDENHKRSDFKSAFDLPRGFFFNFEGSLSEDEFREGLMENQCSLLNDRLMYDAAFNMYTSEDNGYVFNNTFHLYRFLKGANFENLPVSQSLRIKLWGATSPRPLFGAAMKILSDTGPLGTRSVYVEYETSLMSPDMAIDLQKKLCPFGWYLEPVAMKAWAGDEGALTICLVKEGSSSIRTGPVEGVKTSSGEGSQPAADPLRNVSGN
ncbi:MAG: hypothetical protein M1827_004562 [Pycnora praestabilis]|nr:MAG: hypothetical protein M1827_004562 [Pycnora praestabilis]